MASGGSAGRIFAYVLLGAAIVISYQGWKNSQLTTASAELAKQHACDLESTCMVTDDKPRVGRADVIRHRYEFNTTQGMVTVTCKRQLLFFGEWSCTVAEGRLVSDPIP
jgi:hypothetical protein